MERKEEPKIKIIEFISNNQGCTAEQIVDGLKNYHSRVPIFKALKELRKEGIVKDESENRRSYKYFLDANDASILIPLQLEKIVNSFRDWLKSSEAKWQGVRDSEYETFDKAQKDRNLIPTYVQQLIQLMSPDTYYAPLLILRIIVYSVTEHSMVGWIKIICDKDTLNQLISDAFSKVAYLNSCYIEYLNNNYPKYNLETMPLHYAVAGKTFSLLMAMYACRRISIRMGLEKQTDEIFDLLWQFNQDILKFLFPEIEFYKWKFKYGVDNWRRLLEIYENNPDQTLYNIYAKKEC